MSVIPHITLGLTREAFNALIPNNDNILYRTSRPTNFVVGQEYVSRTLTLQSINNGLVDNCSKLFARPIRQRPNSDNNEALKVEQVSPFFQWAVNPS